MEPDWLAKDIEANEKLRKLKAVTTDGHWYPEQDQDGEYTGPGDDPPGYVGEWFQTGGVLAYDDHDDEGPYDAFYVFSPGHPRPHTADAEWVSVAHEDDAEARYDRLLAEYRRLLASRHIHTRDCYDDAGPGAGGVSLICNKIEGVDPA